MLALSDRQSHLSAMGVHQWYTRTKLSGAAPTPETVLFQPAITELCESDLKHALQDSLAPERNVTESLAAVERAHSAMDILKSGGLRPSDGEEPVQESLESRAPVGRNQADSEGVDISALPSLSGDRALDSFSLVLYRTSHGLIISESLEPASHPVELTLLKNIIKSKAGMHDLHDKPEFQQLFSWPVFRSLNLQSKQGGDLPVLLASWINSHCAEDVKSVLYFGAAYPQLKKFYAELVSSRPALSFNVFSHSLADMLRFPQRKSDTWVELCAYFGE
ncbi:MULTISPECIES: hypothetical protein [unclassified Oleiphilus]|nr:MULTISPECIES: hypothetical protein [unclassified Oleiphilus]KZY41605.1 hypothetical protein A3732_17915 [Oleiphilus sp. HI0050]KZZ35064.1 hypothetical protein A3756_16510 [Oleiphilus sp. HI0086]KZZ35806.1 hypothetical protein A3757_14860 [Oleiphilus sp. HI0117]KZZ56308.1 hypothetical protein A3761_09225 [Oleiphilus sp. HI0123]